MERSGLGRRSFLDTRQITAILESNSMINARDLRKGKMVVREGELYRVHEARYVTKGKGGTYMQAKLRSIKQGIMVDVRYRVDEKVEIPYVDSKTYEYLYQDGTGYVLMDTATFDQVTVSDEIMGDNKDFLIPNEKVSCQILNGEIISLELPNVVTLQIIDTPPVVKGSTVQNQPKDATVETGARIRVPAFVEPGDKVRIDTRTGEYLDRAK
jgi:elongation factor P